MCKYSCLKKKNQKRILKVIGRNLSLTLAYFPVRIMDSSNNAEFVQWRVWMVSLDNGELG